MTRDERYHQISYDAGGYRDPELPLWPEDGLTKAESEEYARENARMALEHLTEEVGVIEATKFCARAAYTDLIDEVGRTKASFLMSTWLENGR